MHDFYYFNGDSYSASNPISWVDYFAKKKNILYSNNAVNGSSNSRILRSSIESLLELKNKYNKIFTIIGVSFVPRDEIWDMDSNQLVTLDSKILDKIKISDELKLKLHYQDINHQMIHFYTNLYMFINLLEKWNIDYFIFSAADNSDFGTLNWDYLKSSPIYKEITDNPRIYKLHNFFIKKWANKNFISTNQTGHLIDANGYSLFAEEIENKIQLSVK